MSGLTARGRLLTEILAGETVPAVSQTAMEQLCADLAAMMPRRYCRAHRMAGGYVCAMIGPPVTGTGAVVRRQGG